VSIKQLDKYANILNTNKDSRNGVAISFAKLELLRPAKRELSLNLGISEVLGSE
jgi:hypothetical protein